MEQPIPTVSVLMTAFNRERYIADAIASVLKSSFEDFELIIADDSSTDTTLSIGRQYEADRRVRVVSNTTNIGDYPNRNLAASYAKGKYLKYLDSDDVIYPHGLATMVDCMEAFPEAAIGLSALPDPSGPCPLLLTPRDAYREHFFVRDLLGRAPGSVIIQRLAFESTGGFSGKRQVGDHELWLKVARTYPVVKMPTDLVWDRLHAAQEKHYDNAGEKAAMHDDVRLAALSATDCPLNSEERMEALHQLRANQARMYWTLLSNGHGPAVANQYRRTAKVPLASIAAAAAKRIVKGRQL